MTIRVTSFDFDGCLFNIKYIRSGSKNIIESNKPLLDAIKTENKKCSKSITFIGSNRQSKSVDDANLMKKGSCFPQIKRVSDYIGSELDTFLLADVYGNLHDGTSYERAISSTARSETHSDWLFDNTKATILYAQMHKVACENPSDEITFDFYDDNLIILEDLEQFFTSYPQMIPPNVTLNINDYAGTEVTQKVSLKGNKQSIIDKNYRETIIEMGMIALKSAYPDGYTNMCCVQIDTASVVNANHLKKRKGLIIVPSFTDAKQPENLGKIEEQPRTFSQLDTDKHNLSMPQQPDHEPNPINHPTKKTISSPSSTMSMQILGGFIAAIGCTAVAIAFVALNAATFGIPGLVAAGLGASSYKNREVSVDTNFELRT